MQIPDWLQKRKLLLVTLAVLGVLGAAQPVLWPDGFGLRGEDSTTTTVEKNEQGKITKTVETTTPNEGKTLWDWFSLLGVPLSLAGLGFWIQQREKNRDAATAKEEALQVYFDRISTLLIDKNLRAIAEQLEDQKNRELLDVSVDVIRARTLSILRRFEDDSEIKGTVIQFLIESEIINKLKLSLRGTDLRSVDLRRVELSNVNLSGANLNSADLSGADLRSANLNSADLRIANLFRASLRGAKLFGANLSGANLNSADLRSADLNGAKLDSTDLRSADLFSGNLRDADLRIAKLGYAKLNFVNLRDADLSSADLSGTDLSDANLFNAKLSKIKFTKETIWPNSAEVAKAIYIPEELKKQLGIPTDEPQEPDGSNQS